MLCPGQVTDAMSPLPATLPPDERKRYQHLILAAYPHGRGGALKPLQPTYVPQVGFTTDPSSSRSTPEWTDWTLHCSTR
jgi:hypothetical protein